MNRVLEIDPERRLARGRAGLVLDDLRAAAGEHGLTFGPDPATHDHCTLGGMIGNNSCGVHSVMAGPHRRQRAQPRRADLRRRALHRPPHRATRSYRRVVEAGGREGEILAALKQLAGRHGDEMRRRYPDIPRRVSGYNLDELLPENGFHVGRALVGSEGTLRHRPRGHRRAGAPARRAGAARRLGYEDVYQAADHVMEILDHGPIGLEGLDSRLVADQRKKGMHPDDLELLPKGGGWLLVEFGAEELAEAADKAHRLRDRLRGEAAVVSAEVFTDPDRLAKIWEIRESGLGATAARARPGRHLARLGGLRRAARPRWAPTCATCAACSTTTATTAPSTATSATAACTPASTSTSPPPPASPTTAASSTRAADLVIRHGGVALRRARRRPVARRAAAQALRRASWRRRSARSRRIFDPGNRMNPGKVVDPYPILGNLRLGADYQPWEPKTAFAYPEDDVRLLARRAALRRRRQVPAPGRRHDVPELHGDRRGAALHPRPRPAAVRDAAGRGDHRRLAQRGGQGGARPVLRLQGLQERLPGRRRHGDLQGRVPVALLRGPAAAAHRLQHGRHLLVGAARREGAAAGQPRHPDAGPVEPRQAPRRHLAAPPRPALRAPHLPRHLRRAAPRRLGRAQQRRAARRRRAEPRPGRRRRTRRRAARHPVAGHLQQLLPPRGRRRRRRRAGGGGMGGRGAEEDAVLRPAALRLRLPGDGEAAARGDRRRAGAGDPGRGADGRARAELHRHLPRRAGQHAAARPGRLPAVEADLHPGRAAAPGGQPRRRVRRGWRRGRRRERQRRRDRPRRLAARRCPPAWPRRLPRPLPPQGGDERARRGGVAHRPRPRPRDAGHRLLRHGRLVRLRARQVRRLGRRRRARAAAGGASGRAWRRWSSPTASRAASRSPSRPTAARCTLPRC